MGLGDRFYVNVVKNKRILHSSGPSGPDEDRGECFQSPAMSGKHLARNSSLMALAFRVRERKYLD